MSVVFDSPFVVSRDAVPLGAITDDGGETVLTHETLKWINIRRRDRLDPNDKTSPLHSALTFEQLKLKPELLKSIYELGFNYPSHIQEVALPMLLANPPRNMIAQSQSGTGKTAAFLMAVISRVDPTKRYPQVLIMSPTFELAIQTGDVAFRMVRYMPEIKLRFVTRGETRDRGDPVREHILFGTPGKVLDWALKLKVFDLSKITVFVLDEADEMIAVQGLQDQTIRIHKHLSKRCQMMLFSATYNEDVIEFSQFIIPKPTTTLRLEREEQTQNNIKQYFVRCQSPEDKYRAIENIYGVITVGQAIVFCRTRSAADWLKTKMAAGGHSVDLLSGDLDPEHRLCAIERFRAGLEKVLIATNVAARGIDVPQVSLVINYDPPVDVDGNPDYEAYLHRIGRTGRFGSDGIAINMVDSDRTMDVYRALESHYGKPMQMLDTDDGEAIEKIQL